MQNLYNGYRKQFFPHVTVRPSVLTQLRMLGGENVTFKTRHSLVACQHPFKLDCVFSVSLSSDSAQAYNAAKN